jgi:hypothetical protein
MGFIEKTFDAEKFTRALSKKTGVPEKVTSVGSDVLTPNSLKPVMYQLFVEMLRHERITIRGLDFDSFDECDIDDLENVIGNWPGRELFKLSDVFKGLTPRVPDKRVFI